MTSPERCFGDALSHLVCLHSLGEDTISSPTFGSFLGGSLGDLVRGVPGVTRARNRRPSRSVTGSPGTARARSAMPPGGGRGVFRRRGANRAPPGKPTAASRKSGRGVGIIIRAIPGNLIMLLI